MATLAHCAFCFETLVASFEGTKTLSLARTEELWEQYHMTSNGGGQGEEEGVVVAEEQEEEEAAEEASEVEDDAEMTDVEGEGNETSSSTKRTAISRLLSRETAESAGSSSSSLPSAKSGSSDGSSSKNTSGSLTPATSVASTSDLSSKRTEYPLFVTWNTVSSRSGQKSLRGCIGTFEAQELESALRSYALTSAFEDTRFSPIPPSLLPHLSCEVTLLTNFSSPSRDPLAWTLGKHGIRISFTHHGRRYGATYLPSVAVEQEWTKEETLLSLMRKAGWGGRSESNWEKVWREGRGEIVTYEGEKVALGWKEWRAWRDWVEREVDDQ